MPCTNEQQTPWSRERQIGPVWAKTIKFTGILWKSCFLGYLCFLRETLDKLTFASRCRIRLPNKLIFTMDVEWDCLTNWHHRCLAKNLWTSNIIRGHLQKLTDLLQKIRLVAKNLWFGIRTTDALQKSYEPRASFAATCKHLWICCGKFMPPCGKCVKGAGQHES